MADILLRELNSDEENDEDYNPEMESDKEDEKEDGEDVAEGVEQPEGEQPDDSRSQESEAARQAQDEKDAIARRTRTHFSLQDLSLEVLESRLPHSPEEKETLDVEDLYQTFLKGMKTIEDDRTSANASEDESDPDFVPDEIEGEADEDAAEATPPRMHVSQEEVDELRREHTSGDRTLPQPPAIGAHGLLAESQPDEPSAMQEEQTRTAEHEQCSFDARTTGSGRIAHADPFSFTNEQAVMLREQLCWHFQVLLQVFFLVNERQLNMSPSQIDPLDLECRSAVLQMMAEMYTVREVTLTFKTVQRWAVTRIAARVQHEHPPIRSVMPLGGADERNTTHSTNPTQNGAASEHGALHASPLLAHHPTLAVQQIGATESFVRHLAWAVRRPMRPVRSTRSTHSTSFPP